MAPLKPLPKRLPKLLEACKTQANLEQDRNEILYSVDYFDSKKIRRKKLSLYKCLCMELSELGFIEASRYLSDLVYDNVKLLEEDDIGIVVDLRKRPDYLTLLSHKLQRAEFVREKGDPKKECLILLHLARYFQDREKGILWLADSLYNAAIAVASQYLLDGGRIKALCKYHYASFLLSRFSNLDADESFNILMDVRDASVGKSWLLNEPDPEPLEKSVQLSPETTESIFTASSIMLHLLLMKQVQRLRRTNVSKAEQLARLAERRALDAGNKIMSAQAIQEIGMCQLNMNSLNNAKKTFQRALSIYNEDEHIEGICEANMQLAAVMQRLDEHQVAINLLTDAGNLALQHELRKQLGRTLHFLGELYLRRDEPAFGTIHLSEAFSCFQGFEVKKIVSKKSIWEDITNLEDDELKPQSKEIYTEEAEQSRLMTAVSAGQEIINSYFDLMKQADTCAIARVQIIEWKLSRAEWWIERDTHLDEIPCSCSKHDRNPLEIVRSKYQSSTYYPEITNSGETNNS